MPIRSDECRGAWCIGNGIGVFRNGGGTRARQRKGERENENERERQGESKKRENSPIRRVSREHRIAPRGVALFMAAIDHRPAYRSVANTPLIAI